MIQNKAKIHINPVRREKSNDDKRTNPTEFFITNTLYPDILLSLIFYCLLRFTEIVCNIVKRCSASSSSS